MFPLTTNEIVFSIIIGLLEAMAISLYPTLYLDLKYKKLKTFLIVTIAQFLPMLLSYVLSYTIKYKRDTITNTDNFIIIIGAVEFLLLLTTLLCKFLFKEKLTRYLLLKFAADFNIIYIAAEAVIGTVSEQFNISPLVRDTLFAVATVICVFPLVFILKKFIKGKLKKALKILGIVAVIYTFVNSASEIFIINGMVSGKNEIATNILLIYLYFLIALVVLAAGIIIADYERERKYRMAIDFENEKSQYFDVLKEYSEQIRILNHDVNNQLTTIKALANDKTGDVQDFSNKFAEEYAASVKGFCKNSTLNAMLLFYDRRAKNNNVPFNVDAALSEECRIEPKILIMLFSNILNNAFDAAEKCRDNAFVSLRIVEDKEKNITFSCKNSCTEQPKQKADKTFVSTKVNNRSHGFGTKIIVNTLKDLSATFNFNSENNTFEISAYIPVVEN